MRVGGVQPPTHMNEIAVSGPLGPLFTWFDRVLVPPLRRFGELPAMVAIREVLPISFAGLLAGAAVMFWFIHADTLGGRFFTTLIAGFGTMSATLVALLSFRFARLVAAPVALAAITACTIFALSLPQPYGRDLIVLAKDLGPSGLLLAIVIALVTVGAIDYAHKRANVAGGVFAATLLVAIALGLFLLHVSLASGIAALMRPLGTLGDSFPAFLLIVIVETLLWSAGIHGPALLAGVITPVYLALQVENMHAQAAHTPLPHIVTVSLFLFVFPGGAGATLPLLAMLMRSTSERARKVAWTAALPAIFNINEPVLLGLPIVMNPILVVPLVVAPAVLACVTYAAVALGMVARPSLYIPSSVPGPIAVFLATGDWRAVVLLLVNIALSAVIYYPFFRAYEVSVKRA